MHATHIHRTPQRLLLNSSSPTFSNSAVQTSEPICAPCVLYQMTQPEVRLHCVDTIAPKSCEANHRADAESTVTALCLSVSSNLLFPLAQVFKDTKFVTCHA
jgi:hypothetical protein